MQHIAAFLARPKLRVLSAGVILLLSWAVQSPRLAASDSAQVGCARLTAAPSSNNSDYILTATSFGDTSHITGYRFNFGDHQSYDFTLDAAGPQQNQNEVTIEHTYASQGVYTATVFVDTRHGDKTNSTESAGCRTVIADGPTVLLDTGSGNTPLLFTAAFGIGLFASEVWLKYIRRQPPTLP